MASLIPRSLMRLLPKIRPTIREQSVGVDRSVGPRVAAQPDGCDALSNAVGPFRDLEATAVMCALHRARETEQRRPRLYDPYARQLVEAAKLADGRMSSMLSPRVRMRSRQVGA